MRASAKRVGGRDKGKTIYANISETGPQPPVSVKNKAYSGRPLSI